MTLVFEIVDALSPVEACARFVDRPYPLLLESARPDNDAARYSFLAADPPRVLRQRGPGSDPFTELAATLDAHRTERLPDLPPFQAGAGGYLGYDLAHHLERLPEPRHDDLGLPDLCLGFYDWTLAWDHARGRTYLFSSGFPERGPAQHARAEERALEVKRRLALAVATPRPALPAVHSSPPLHAVAELPGFASTFSRDAFVAAVARTREYVLAGDIFQANLSQRFEADWPASAFELYSRLRERNPAPFAAYFDIGDAQVVSASPERFLLLSGDRVETRPIKGTSPRGVSPRHDSALGVALAESEKDRAENVMIVDLLRNDLSKVCRDGSVEVPELCRVERYATVHHLVSTVVGRLREGLGAVDLLRATWPGGSITGAPKVRAMQIIAALEPTRRGVYTGSLGYLSFTGDMDTSIAIRTFVVKGDRAFAQAGAGIVADSSPEREYDETIDKARGLAAALETRA